MSSTTLVTHQDVTFHRFSVRPHLDSAESLCATVVGNFKGNTCTLASNPPRVGLSLLEPDPGRIDRSRPRWLNLRDLRYGLFIAAARISLVEFIRLTCSGRQTTTWGKPALRCSSEPLMCSKSNILTFRHYGEVRLRRICRCCCQ